MNKGKDPAFLFYTGDFSTGTQFLTDEQLGKYLRLLMAQHQHGHLHEHHMIIICKSHDNHIFSKFEQDENGLYFNKRLEYEIVKRQRYSESRSKNKTGKTKVNIISKSYENHIENKDIYIDKVISLDSSFINKTISKKDKLINDDFDFINYTGEEILKKFNSICVRLNKIQSITPDRLEAIKFIKKKYGLESFDDVFLKTSESDYLNGGGKDKWIADFDWILKPINFVKILENKYQKNTTDGITTTTSINSNQGYKPAKFDTAGVLRELTDDFKAGNIPGDYSENRFRNKRNSGG